MRLSLKFFVVAMSLHGMILPNENIQSTSFSSYLRGAALFCAGAACMKGTSYLYQRYWSPKSKSTLDAVRRSMSMQSPIASNISMPRQNDNNGSLAKLKFVDGAPSAAQNLFQGIEAANKLIANFDVQWKSHREGLGKLQKDIDNTFQVDQTNGSGKLSVSQADALQGICEVYRRQIENRRLVYNLVERSEQNDQEEIGNYYAIFSTQKSKTDKPNFLRRLSSMFGTLTRTGT